jgi:hypothetical protein
MNADDGVTSKKWIGLKFLGIISFYCSTLGVQRTSVQQLGPKLIEIMQIVDI